MNVLDLAQKHVQLKKASSTNGGEWHGPCPGCGGRDRFCVWPEQCHGKGAYWCRACGKTGDNIQFLRDFEGKSFRDACAELNIDLPGRIERGQQERRPKPEFHPESHPLPADLWQEKAGKLVSWSRECLAKNDEMLTWLAGRGIDRTTAENYSLGWNPGEEGKDIYRARKGWGIPEAFREDGKPKALWIPRGLIIPYIIDGVVFRIRIRRPEGEPRYYVLPGSSMATMIISRERRAFVIVESELDAIAVAASNATTGAMAMGSAAAKPDAEAFALLDQSLEILNALDYDIAGARAMEWWMEQFDHCIRWPVPQGKDPGDAVRLGIDLDEWITAGLPPALTMFEVGKKEEKKAPVEDLSDVAPGIVELRHLLRNNPGVKIINTENRLTVLRQGKYVGGRIGELVFRDPEVLDYIMRHPAEEIDGTNIIKSQ